MTADRKERDFRPANKWRKTTATITMVALCAIIGVMMMVVVVEQPL